MAASLAAEYNFPVSGNEVIARANRATGQIRRGGGGPGVAVVLGVADFLDTTSQPEHQKLGPIAGEAVRHADGGSRVLPGSERIGAARKVRVAVLDTKHRVFNR